VSEKAVCRIIEREWIAPDHYILRLEDRLSEKSLPGQFVMISPRTPTEPFFKRPYSIFRRAGGELQLLIKVVGRGSKQTSAMPVGSEIKVVGPLGNHFGLDARERLALLVGGGIGMAPLYELAETLSGKSVRVAVLLGARTCGLLLIQNDFRKLGVEVHCATDDGSEGLHGNVGHLLKKYLDGQPEENVRIYSCGPEVMMRGVAEIAAQYCLPCELSLEAHMGCGFGVCLGCVVENHKGEYRRVCKDGPVFDAREIYG